MHSWQKRLAIAGCTAVVAALGGCGSAHQAKTVTSGPILVRRSAAIDSAWRSLVPRNLSQAISTSLGPNTEAVLAWNPSHDFAKGRPTDTRPWDPVLYVLHKSSARWTVQYQDAISAPGTPTWLYLYPAGAGRTMVVSAVMNLSADGYGGNTVAVDSLSSAGKGQHLHTFAFGPHAPAPVARRGTLYVVGGYHAIGLTWGASAHPTWRSYPGDRFPLLLPLAGKPVFLQVATMHGKGELRIAAVTGVPSGGAQQGNAFHLAVPAGSNLVFLPSRTVSSSSQGMFSIYRSLGDMPPNESNASATWSEITGPLGRGQHQYLLTYARTAGHTASLHVVVDVASP